MELQGDVGTAYWTGLWFCRKKKRGGRGRKKENEGKGVDSLMKKVCDL
ncbi:MAG: hypothetical protein U9R21_08940 [Candidatus Thermoplasmatota archaeon]|nr:hypothetical protein [Candidatus Thermoplasmatota archaeon]